MSPDEFNYVLPVVNQEVFTNELKKVLQVYGQPSFVDAYKNSYLRECEYYYVDALGGGQEIFVPPGFEMFISGKVLINDTEWKRLTILNSLSAFDNVNGMLGANDENVEGVLVRNTMRFNCDIYVFEMIYVGTPTTPFYDCFITQDYQVIYLPPNIMALQVGPNFWNVTLNGVIYANVAGGNGTWINGQNHTSLSSEFVWNDKLLPVVTNLIFEKMGINIREQVPIEVSQIKKAQ
jgi:hypothetical protein